MVYSKGSSSSYAIHAAIVSNRNSYACGNAYKSESGNETTLCLCVCWGGGGVTGAAFNLNGGGGRAS